MTQGLDIGDKDLAKRFKMLSGSYLRPDDAGYDDARRIHNSMIDKKPSLIVQCVGTSDAVDALNFARAAGLEVSIRGGGHNVAGKALTDGGLMIDLSQMRGVHVDPAAKTARVQGGATWAELNRETQIHGLAVTGGVISSTGVAGLTLGGGFGWIMGKYGMAVDSLISAEVITADGRVVTASPEENEDLFWGIRGGGGNFGIVPWFEFQLNPVGPVIVGGLVAHPFPAAAEMLKFYRDYAWDGPDDRTAFAGLLPAPDGSGHKLAAMLSCHLGQQEEAEKDLQPMREFGSPILDGVHPMPYAVLNSMLDDGFPKGVHYYWKSAFLAELPDEAIEIMVSQYEKCPSKGSGILVEHFHGEVSRVPVEATAFPHRRQAFNLVCASVWANPAATEDNVTWTKETFEAMTPFLTDSRYGNYMAEDDVGLEPARAAYGPNYDRLVEIKSKWDPENLFHLNLNIPPEG